MKRNVISREYKVMLKTEHFETTAADLLGPSDTFWTAFTHAILPLVLDTDGNLDTVNKQRAIRFFDSVQHRLRTQDYVFRERVDQQTQEREVTLKFRHPDRYIAQGRDMSAADRQAGKTKFEEDIKLPFLKLYSFSTKQPIAADKVLNKMNDPGRLFPDLAHRLPGYDGDDVIQAVGDFTAHETVISGADFQIGERPKVEAECALVAWYDACGQQEHPVVVEFSFKYENEEEDYDGIVAQRAYEVFAQLNDPTGDLARWIDRTGPTKTQFVYARA